MITPLKNLKISFSIAILLVSGIMINAQDLNKEVYVVRPYEPTLSDAEKHSFLPSVNNMETSIPSFQYKISPKRFDSAFEPDPIKAAKTVTTSLPKIYHSWLKLGLGNYSTPMAEFNISNLRSKEYSLGAYMYHKSSNGKVLLDNDVPVNAGYVDNLIQVYGKRFFSGVTLAGSLNFEQHAFNYYGYNTDTIRLPFELDKDTVRQRNYKPGIDLELKSTRTDPEDFNFNIKAGFDYFIDRQKNKEPYLKFKTQFTKGVSGFLGGLDMSLDYSRLTNNMDTAETVTNNTIFRFNPWISKSSEDWQFKLGFEAAADINDISRFYLYPRANLDIIIVKDVLIPFIGVTGEIEQNNYQNLFNENMFIAPGLALKNTSKNFEAYGGLKGNISSVIRFRADATVTVYKDYHFFINDTLTPPNLPPLQNKFTGVYDDVNLITYHGQVAYTGKSFDLMIDGKYFDYKTFEELKPWHMPDFTIDLDAVYRYNKFDFGAGFNILGNRWVKKYQADPVRLKPVFDANLSINYHYSKVLTVFTDFYNLSERSYYIWNQYPSQRFNFMVGFSYKL